LVIILVRGGELPYGPGLGDYDYGNAEAERACGDEPQDLFI
jgi:hypothetical protein